MCGINGYWDTSKKLRLEQLRSIVHAMNDKIIYRGPDGEGIFSHRNLCMGMRRLSIIDVNNGYQPIYNENKTLAVVYNGEIYNFKNIRRDLIERGHVFVTECDTEIIVHAFEEYGITSFDMFDGMFAFAVYDLIADCLYLVRDRMGEKPLYYFSSPEHFIFGSEIKSLMSTSCIHKTINTRALNQYVRLSYIPAPLTIYDGIYKLRPGHYLKVSSNGNIEDHEYWDIPISLSEISFEEAAKELCERMNESVKGRMISDVPLGAFLSGGIDSASIVSLMRETFCDDVIQTFTIGSDIKIYDERDRAKIIAEHNQTQHHEKEIGYDSFLSTVDYIISEMGEPFADSSMIPTYLLSKFVKEYVTVALTGDAGDELFAGYNKYLISYYAKIYRMIPDFIRRPVSQMIYKSKPMGRLHGKIRKTIINADKDACSRHIAMMHMGVKEEETDELMTEKYRDNRCMEPIKEIYGKHSESTDLQKALYTDLKIVLEGDMLVKVDRMSMLNSLETRIPLLSKDIVELAMSFPDEYKLKGRKRKRVLKEAMNPILPKGFDKYPKSGFEIPIGKWLKEEMRDELTRLFRPDIIENQGFFNYDYIDKIIREHISGRRDRRDELWVLYVFEKWYQQEIVA